MKHITHLAAFLLAFTACGDGDGPAWTEDPGDEASAPAGDPSPRVRPDEDDPAPPPSDRGLTLEHVWGDGLELEVDGLAWTAPGEMRFRVELIDPATGQSVPYGAAAGGVGEPRFREDGVDLGAEALFEVRRTQDLHVTLVLDLSRSVREAGAFEALRAAARRLVDTLPREARVAVVGFASEHALLVDFDDDDLHATLETLDAPEGRAGQFTNLWGAVRFAAEHLAESSTGDHAARALVVFTDGRDNVAEAGRDGAAEATAAARAAVFAVGLGADVDAEALEALAGPGRYTGVQSPSALGQVFDDVATRLSDRLTIEYVTPKRSGTHTLDVELGTGDRGAGFQVRFEL